MQIYFTHMYGMIWCVISITMHAYHMPGYITQLPCLMSLRCIISDSPWQTSSIVGHKVNLEFRTSASLGTLHHASVFFGGASASICSHQTWRAGYRCCSQHFSAPLRFLALGCALNHSPCSGTPSFAWMKRTVSRGVSSTAVSCRSSWSLVTAYIHACLVLHMFKWAI